MEYLHLFENSTAHDAVYNGDEYQEPWVAYIEDDEMVTYNKPPHDYSKDYLTFEALEDGTFTFIIDIYEDEDNLLDITSVSYSIDNGETWVTESIDASKDTSITTPLITAGNKVLWKGLGTSFYNSMFESGARFVSTGRFNVSGNINSLIYGDEFKDSLTTELLGGLFYDNTNLISAKNLILPATTLVSECYQQMFYCCTSLTSAPELPATTLADYCYYGMFNMCTSLTTAPELPATTLAKFCYENMFGYCTSLATAPNLPATTLTEYCYRSMFSDCTSLVTVPNLPATTLTYYCYAGMFSHCTSLTSAPELPATTLANGCYSSMFSSCTSLATAPELPATALTDSCYVTMFDGCTSLVSAPELPATTLINTCYRAMFYGCTSLNYIKAMFTTTPSEGYTYNWVSGVASSGTFVKNSAATWTETGNNGIPNGWTVETASV